MHAHTHTLTGVDTKIILVRFVAVVWCNLTKF